jgi:hypothetical protein
MSSVSEKIRQQCFRFKIRIISIVNKKVINNIIMKLHLHNKKLYREDKSIDGKFEKVYQFPKKLLYTEANIDWYVHFIKYKF